MSVATDKTAEQKIAHNPYPGSPVIKDVWTVASGNYVPKFVIKGALLISGSDTSAVLNYKLRLDDTTDAVTFLTGMTHPIGDAIAATAVGTTAVTVVFFG